MEKRFSMEGKVMLVTGASAGIGRALSAAMALKGATVFGCARNDSAVRHLAEEVSRKGATGTIIAIQCDLTEEDAILSMFAQIQALAGRLDVCINNAGLSFDCSLLEGDTQQWRTMCEVNVLALCICTREAVRLMKDTSHGGHIVHLSSMSAHRIPDVLTATMYVANKQMVRVLAQGHETELRGTGIRVSMVSPGLVETEFEYRCFSDRPEIASEIYSSVECLQAEDMVEAVLHILEAPDHVTIQDILVRPTQQHD